MKQNDKCWYSLTGLNQLNRKQREGVIQKVKEGMVTVLWEGNKTPNKISNIFITTDPLAKLFGQPVKSQYSQYIDIDEHTWISVEKKGIYIIQQGNPEQKLIPHVEFLHTIEEKAVVEAAKKFL